MPRKQPPKPGASYYEGGYRLVRDGIPCRVAAWVADLTPHGRSLLLRGSKNPPVSKAAQAMRHAETLYLFDA